MSFWTLARSPDAGALWAGCFTYQTSEARALYGNPSKQIRHATRLDVGRQYSANQLRHQNRLPARKFPQVRHFLVDEGGAKGNVSQQPD